MQTIKGLKMSKIISNTLRNEGMLAFYKGMSAPLISVPLINSIIFASYEFYVRTENLLFRSNKQNKSQIQFGVALRAGMFAGFVNSFILSPIELIKCRL